MPDVDSLIDDLGRGETLRARAEAALLRLGTDGVPHLCAALIVGKREVRPHVADLLGDLRDARAIGHLSRALNDSFLEVRWRATRALVRIGTPAVEALCRAISNPDHGVRRLAADALLRMRDPRTIPLLVANLYHARVEVRTTAAELLAASGALAVPALLECLRHQRDGRVREAATFALVNMTGEAALPGLRIAARDHRRSIRHLALSGLATVGVPAIPNLCEALRDPDISIRERAAVALQNIAVRVPSRELRRALPILRRLPASFSLETEESLRAYRSAERAIIQATGPHGDLPLPSRSAGPSPEKLPIPAGR